MAFKKHIPSVQAVQAVQAYLAYLSLHENKEDLGAAGSWELGLLTFISTRAPSVYSTGATPGLAIGEICRSLFWEKKLSSQQVEGLSGALTLGLLKNDDKHPIFFMKFLHCLKKMYHFQEKLTRLPTCMGRTSMKSQLSYHIHVRLTSTPRTIFAVACLGKKKSSSSQSFHD